MDLDHQLIEALLSIDRAGVATLLNDAEAEHGISHTELADQVIAPALEQIGDAWETGHVALSQVYMAGRLLEEIIRQWPVPPRARGASVVGVAVLGDHHSLGKRIIGSVLRSAGCDVRDLGAGLEPKALVDRAEAEGVTLLMISVLMLHRALRVREVRTLLDERGLDGIQLVVGGAPFIHDPQLWERVGAHAMGRSAADALRLATGKGGAK